MIEILNGLARGTFAEIVQTRDDDEAAAGVVEHEADVGEVRMRDMLNFRKRTGFPDADHGTASIGLAIKSFDRFGSLRHRKRHVNRGENSSRDRKKMRGEN